MILSNVSLEEQGLCVLWGVLSDDQLNANKFPM